jgi:hypothetical protein
MRFGIFDHIDDAGVPLAQLYEDRLRLAERYDRAVAEESERAGTDYLCADVAFGDIAFEEAARTVDLLGEQVIRTFSGP